MKRLELSTLNLEIDQEITKIYENHCLIGKILLHKPLDQTLVKFFAQREWKLTRDLKVSKITQNMFIFTFQDKADLVHVLKNKPWTIMGGLLMLNVCTSREVPHELNFSYSPFWVQVHGLPLNYVTKENVCKIGAYLGIFVCTDWKYSCEEISWRKFVRLRVVLDVTKPLVTGFWLERSGLSDVWIDLKYEKLGVFCFKCGRIGESFRTCKFPAGDDKFGPWLRADLWDRPVFRERLKIMDKRGDNRDGCSTTLLAKPKAKATLVQSSKFGICRSVEFQETSREDKSVSRRNLCQRLVCNIVDSMIMLMNCGIVFSRVKYMDESEGKWTLFIWIAAYLVHLSSKFIRVSWFLRAKNGKDNAISEILISIVFLVMLVSL